MVAWLVGWVGWLVDEIRELNCCNYLVNVHEMILRFAFCCLDGIT